MSQNRVDYELDIDELVLNGFSRADGHRIAQALRQELSQLFMGGGVPESFQNDIKVSNMDLGSVEVERGSRPEAIGSNVARSIYNGVTK